MITRRRFLQWFGSVGFCDFATIPYGVIVEPLLRQRATRYNLKLRHWPDDLHLSIASFRTCMLANRGWTSIESIQS